VCSSNLHYARDFYVHTRILCITNRVGYDRNFSSASKMIIDNALGTSLEHP